MKRAGLIIAGLFLILTANAQPTPTGNPWIQPADEKSPPIWGIHNGIVVGLWPAAIEKGPADANTGGPRGLLRIGYEYLGTTYLINFIAIEPLVNDDMEFSEVSPSSVDGKWGKFCWAAGDTLGALCTPYANTKGNISHPDPLHPDITQLSFYVFIEKFLDGANPYLKLTIRSDHPGELGIQVFDREKISVMQRCALTATMGNYARLRRLYVKDQVVDAGKLFAGYHEIGFAEKEPYPSNRMLRNRSGDFIAVAASDQTLAELAAWPQDQPYLTHWGWRYRPFYQLTQYWRAPAAGTDSASLQVRVNARVKYWGGDSPDPSKYIDIPGGPAFENFELREKFISGQQFIFGLTMKTPAAFIAE